MIYRPVRLYAVTISAPNLRFCRGFYRHVSDFSLGYSLSKETSPIVSMGDGGRLNAARK